MFKLISSFCFYYIYQCLIGQSKKWIQEVERYSVSLWELLLQTLWPFLFPTPTPIYYCLSSGHSYFILPTCKIALSLSGLSKVSWLWHQAQVQYYLIFIFCECKWKYLDAAPLDSELSKIKWHTQHLIVSQDQNNHNEQMAISELRRAHVASFTYYALQQ